MDWTLVFIAMIAGMIPMSFLVGIGLAFVIYLVTKPREFEVELLDNINPGDASKIAAAVARRGYDVAQFHDEKVGLTHLVIKRQKSLL